MEASRIWLLAKSPRIRISGRGESSWIRVSSAMAADFCLLVIHKRRSKFLPGRANKNPPYPALPKGEKGDFFKVMRISNVFGLYFVKSFFFHVLVHSLEKPR